MLSSEEKKEQQKSHSKTPSPVRTADEWFEQEGLTTWPLPIASEGELDLSAIEQKLETKESLLQDLKSHASFNINVLDEFLDKVNGLEEFISSCASQFIDIKEEQDNENVLIQSTKDTNEEATEYQSSLPWQKRKSDISTVSRKRTVENAVFPGFRSGELTPLPGSLEAPQLLNKVTNIQYFRGSFKKIWKQYFLSEATVAIFQDTFWWWFLHRFQQNPKSQAYLFNRLADSFVGLFLSISIREKDLFFQKFADCLAQAIYAAFCESFPMSFKLFDDDFRNDLLNTLSEWITGIRSPPNAWKTWQLEYLESDQIQLLREDRTQQLKSSLSFNQDTFLELDIPLQGLDKKLTFNTTQLKLYKSVKESHQAGPGPQFQRVAFNLHGKSPLITHFLSANRKQLEGPSAIQKLVTRTEIEKFPPPFPTYHDIIQRRKKEARIASRKYMETMRAFSAQEREKTFSQKQETTNISHGNPDIQSAMKQVTLDEDEVAKGWKSDKEDDEADGILTKVLNEPFHNKNEH